ncbi:MAG: alanine--tRNA ligase [Enterobacteriaceae bacterium PSpyr]|nr:MAG: alanine--tRNA ligase [Enterobacteriaceae bacterium PSpyr]
MIKNLNEIREIFLKFFKFKKHKIIKSSKLIPKNDNTILFTNSGMNQFKNVFLGLEKIKYSRIATSQRCIRVGGKHNDFKNVGKTSRHHTFFEMLGNFSFNDYFKFDAINYAWELLTSQKWFNLPKNKLLVTVYSSDKETYNIWNKCIKIPKNKIIIIGDNKNIPFKSDNFWQTGKNYPCGPCTEIFYDKGCHINGNLPGQKNIGERYIEIWNIVFIQFILQYNGNIKPLPNLSIDTGMGLERITSILQGVNSNYEINSFKKIVNKIKKNSNNKNINIQSVYIISDHIRAIVFLILDGIIPSNEKRGYVLRRIIRRALRHGNKLGIKNFFLYKLINYLSDFFGDQYTKFITNKKKIQKIIKYEEQKFIYSLKNGLKLLNLEFKNIKNGILNGKIIFNLYNTYGFPIDLIEEICIEKNIKIDRIKFNLLMNEQRLKTKNINKFKIKHKNIINYNYYNILKKKNLKIIAIFYKFNLINKIYYNEKAIIILNNNYLYYKKKIQIGDQGILIKLNNMFLIYNIKKYNKTILYFGILIKGKFKNNDYIKIIINKKNHYSILKNHSVTHLLYNNLKKILNNNIKKKKININYKYIVFDFLYNSININKINNIEKSINKQIIFNFPIYKKKMLIKFCKKKHVNYINEIGIFHIKKKYYIKKNIYRIIANTGIYAFKTLQSNNNIFKNIVKLFNVNKKNINNILINLYKKKKKNKIKINKYNNYICNNIIFLISKKIFLFNKINLIINNIKIFDINLLINIINNFKKKINPLIIILIIKNEYKNYLIINTTLNLIKYIRLNLIMKKIINNIGGNGKTSKNLLKIEINNINIIKKILKIIKFIFI